MHGRWIGFASLGVRTFGPIIPAWAAGQLAGLGGVYLGLVAGVAGAVALDATVFAYEPAPTKAHARSFPLPVTPSFVADGRGTAHVGLSGSF